MSKLLKTMWKSNGKHKKLPEEVILKNIKDDYFEEEEGEHDTDVVVSFKLKYLGSTIIEKVAHQETLSIEAIKTILKDVKSSRRKVPRVNVNVSLKGISVADLKGNDLFKVSIYRISNCCTNPSHRQIFSFISTDQHENTECHAFLCAKRKTAETVALTVAHSFSMAYEQWRILPSTLQYQKDAIKQEKVQMSNIIKTEPSKAVDKIEKFNENDIVRQRQIVEQNIMDQLINLDYEDNNIHQDFANEMTANWVSFEDNQANKGIDLILS